jgi:dUTP pyrophosphatase
MKMKVHLDEGAYMPERAHKTDAGLDLRAKQGFMIEPYESMSFDTGVHIALPPRTYGKIESKSGLNINHGVVSCGGVIDEGYTGSIRVKLYNLSGTPYRVRRGDKIAQLIVMPYYVPQIEEVDALEETERGNNGFGSTGK